MRRADYESHADLEVLWRKTRYDLDTSQTCGAKLNEREFMQQPLGQPRQDNM